MASLQGSFDLPAVSSFDIVTGIGCLSCPWQQAERPAEVTGNRAITRQHSSCFHPCPPWPGSQPPRHFCLGAMQQTSHHAYFLLVSSLQGQRAWLAHPSWLVSARLLDTTSTAGVRARTSRPAKGHFVVSDGVHEVPDFVHGLGLTLKTHLGYAPTAESRETDLSACNKMRRQAIHQG